MTSLGCVYLTVNPVFSQGILDFSQLAKLTKVKESDHFIHYRSKDPLVIKANGLEQKAIIKEYKEIERWD